MGGAAGLHDLAVLHDLGAGILRLLPADHAWHLAGGPHQGRHACHRAKGGGQGRLSQQAGAGAGGGGRGEAAATDT